HPLDFVEQMRVGINAALATFVDVNQRRVSAPPAFNVMIERVVGQVSLCAYIPLEGRSIPFQHLVPLAEPRQLVRRPSPKTFGILLSFFDPLLRYWTDQVVRDGRCGVLLNCSLCYVLNFR